MGKESTDAHIRRLETELREKDTFANEIISRAQGTNRDLTPEEKDLIGETRGRIEEIRSQLETVEDYTRSAHETLNRTRQISQAIDLMHRDSDVPEVEFRSAGDYALAMYASALGKREATERLEAYYRAAAHQTTPDNLGVVPDPVLGDVINFIDAARPIVSMLNPQPLTAATWHRPKVTQRPSVGPQGAAGLAADEKSELVSQKMLITRLTANAVTYGGYVNVSKQNIDFSSPNVMDLVINGLAAEYSIDTEGAAADELMGVATTPQVIGSTAETITSGLWAAAATVYTAVRGQGRLVIAVAPDKLEAIGPLFAPVNPRDAQSPGFTAGVFGQGVMGTVSGIPVVMSAGLTGTEAVLFSTAAIEAWEQRVGTLQVTEPSVMGVQVAYAGYFTPLVIEAAGIVPLVVA